MKRGFATWQLQISHEQAPVISTTAQVFLCLPERLNTWKGGRGVPRCLPNPSETSYHLLLHKPSQEKKCLCHKLIMTASLQALSDTVKFILSWGLTNPIRAPLSDCMDLIIPLALNNREMFVFN